jgi:hypothetical protein
VNDIKMGGKSSKEEKFFKTKKGIKVKKMEEPNPSDPPVEVIEDEPEYFGEDSARKGSEENSKNSARYNSEEMRNRIEKERLSRAQAPKILSPKQQQPMQNPHLPNQNQLAFQNPNNLNSMPVNSNNYTNPSMQNVVVMPSRLPPLELQKGAPYVAVHTIQPTMPYAPIQSIQRTQQVVLSPRRF